MRGKLLHNNIKSLCWRWDWLAMTSIAVAEPQLGRSAGLPHSAFEREGGKRVRVLEWSVSLSPCMCCRLASTPQRN